MLCGLPLTAKVTLNKSSIVLYVPMCLLINQINNLNKIVLYFVIDNITCPMNRSFHQCKPVVFVLVVGIAWIFSREHTIPILTILTRTL